MHKLLDWIERWKNGWLGRWEKKGFDKKNVQT